MAQDISNIVNVQVLMGNKAASTRDFGTLLMISSSGVISPLQRVKFYESITEVASDFSTTSSEYQASLLYFGQSPSPNRLAIGARSLSPSSAVLTCGKLGLEYKNIQAWQGLAPFDFGIRLNGTLQEVDVISSEMGSLFDLEDLADLFESKMTNITCSWNGERFLFTSTTTGQSVTISYLETITASVKDVSRILNGTSDSGASIINGKEMETELDALNECMDVSADWYGVTFLDFMTNDVTLEVAQVIEAATPVRMLGLTVTDTAVLSSVSTNDIGSLLKEKGFKRTVWQFSTDSKYAIVSYLAKLFTINFNGTNTMITMKFKVEPGVAYEDLSSTQLSALQNKNGNVFIYNSNDTAILQEGVQANGEYTDEVYGIDWFANYVQNAVFNTFYTSSTKISATDGGLAQIRSALIVACNQAFNNGLLATRNYSGSSIGGLNPGSTVQNGYYIYIPSVNTQIQSDREGRKTPVIQIVAMLSGAFHSADVIINVIR